MYLLDKPSQVDKIIEMINDKPGDFSLIDSLYIFGSILVDDVISNDVDVLVVCKDYSQKTSMQLHGLSLLIQDITGLSVDYTKLSERELEETDFLRRIKNYIKVK